MNEFQKQIYDIFLETKRVCEKLNIKLIACGGTLLGAARHQGFIPWDDDMDFYMLRDDYEKFCKFGKKIINEKYFIQCHKSDHDWWFPFMKVRKNDTCAMEKWFTEAKFHHGIWLDIFPLDKQFSDKALLFKDETKRKILWKRIAFPYSYWQKHGIDKLKMIYYSKLVLIKHPFLSCAYRKLEHLARKYHKKDCPMFGSVWDDKTKDKNCMLFEKKLFEEFIELPFEGTTILCNKNYDRVLTIQYGDWRKLPPIEERQPKHAIIKLDFFNSYKKYL